MSVMNVLDRSGDTRIEWNPAVPEEVSMAKKAFDEAKKKKYLTYRLRADGTQGELIREFDPRAERIVATPQTVGG